MLILMVTSVITSRTLFSLLPIVSSFAARQLHAQAAYWALVTVAVHLGLRWTMIIALMRRWLHLGAPSAYRAWIFRIVALVIAYYGVRSWSVIATGSRLIAESTISFWNFEESVLKFFVNQGAVVGLFVCLTHYAATIAQTGRRGSR